MSAGSMTSENLPVAVEHLGTMVLQIGSRAPIEHGPQGSRVIVNVLGGTFEGPRLKGTIEAPAGDWITMRDDGSYRLDVRQTLHTEDGAVILMTHSGIGRATETGSVIRTAMQFEAGDSRYKRLNRILAIGLGSRSGSTVTYEVYALL